jgi:hypothetical protein
MNYGPPPRQLVDTIIPQSARDMAKYQTDPRWAAQIIADAGEPPEHHLPRPVVLISLGIAGIIAWAAIAAGALIVWSILAGD